MSIPPKFTPPGALETRAINVNVNAQTTIRMPNDPHVDSAGTTTTASGAVKTASDDVSSPAHWYDPATAHQYEPANPGHPVRQGNDVAFLIDGSNALPEMATAIRTATGPAHYVYLLGWWLSDGFPLIPGDAATTALALFRAASARSVQVRAMLWDQWGRANSAQVAAINALDHGSAILDNRTLDFGAHHQKILIVFGTEGLIAFCGGVDINEDRVNVVPSQAGSPMHDVHCKIVGPAAFDLLQTFTQRWQDHPDHGDLDAAKGVLWGLNTSVSNPLGNHSVQIGRTFGNGNNNRGIDSDHHWLRARGYSFAPDGEQTAWRLILRAIQQARRFIYIEDQYLFSMDASRALQAALPNIEHLTILIPHGSIMGNLPQCNYRRQQFIAPLRAAGGAKVRVFYLTPPGNPRTYVHAKMYVMDDQFAIIGSANCNRRGFTHDSEVVAGIFDTSQDDALSQHFAHQLRIRLWAEHLNLNTPEGLASLNDGVASAVHWLHPPPGAHIAVFDENADIERIHTDFDWNTFVDPDGS